MTTPLPEPEHDDHVDVRFKRHNCYTADQLRDYGAAEYKRGIEDAAKFAEAYLVRQYGGTYGIAAEIRKLGETS